ncbi:hypothetical protein OHB54_01585 [Streptomyces sp. NBC_01007]|nr:hypothetical protein OHB54_01585 [Streptomyces sp. NBC_01007]
MTRHGNRPLLFLDVDGPLLPFGDDPQRDLAGTASNSHLARLNPQIGPRLAALPCDLVWATTWEEEANIELAPRLGLPQLPVVNWPEPSAAHEREDQWFGLHWKTRTLVACAALPTGELTGTRSTWGDASRSCQGWPASFSDVGPQVGTLSLAATRRHGMPAP